MAAELDEAVRQYLAAIPTAHRALFDRLHKLILTDHPDAALTISYQLPTYRVGRHRLHVGVWKHGVSIYGWRGRDGGFTARHPELLAGKGTIQLTVAAAADLPDSEFRTLVRAALGDPAGAG